MSVFYAYETLNMWAGRIIEMGQKLPVDFDYAFFFKGISLILEGEHAVSISKALWMIYNSYCLFPSTLISFHLLTNFQFKVA